MKELAVRDNWPFIPYMASPPPFNAELRINLVSAMLKEAIIEDSIPPPDAPAVLF